MACLSVAAPYLWNSPPGDIKNSSSTDIFNRKFKTCTAPEMISNPEMISKSTPK